MNRRGMLQGTALGLAAAAALPTNAAERRPLPTLDLEDPVTRARVRAKMSGSTREKTVYGLTALHLYAYLHEGNMKPLMTMYNYTVTKWKPASATTFTMKHYESGVYTRFNTMEVLEYWDNPITNERRKVFPFLTGPINGTLGPDGMVTGAEATVKPASMGIQVIGDQVYVPTQSSFSFPNPFNPKEWPKESSGPTYFWDSYSTLSARLEEVADPDRDSVRTSQQFQNLVSWHPWLGMGDRPGRTFGRAYGNKLANGFSDVPAPLRAAIEKQTPEMLDIENWKEFRNDMEDYKKANPRPAG